jgi:hypothetical protein
MLTASSGNLTMHLNAKHNLYETDVNDSEKKQVKISSVPLAVQKKLDSSICQFVVTSHVGHSFVESESFLDPQIYEGGESMHDDTFKAEICSSSWVTVLKQLGLTLPPDYNAAFRALKLSDDELHKIAEGDSVIRNFCDNVLLE